MEYAIIINDTVVTRIVGDKDAALKHIEGIKGAEISDSVEAQIGTVKQGGSFVTVVPVGISRSPAEAKSAKYRQIDSHRDNLFYTDVDVTFPEGVKAIRFRNQNDRQNLLDVVMGALILKIDGKGGDDVTFITVDDVIQILTADEMIAVGNFVLQEKKSLIYKGRLKKDAVNALSEDQDLEEALIAFPIDTDW